jgi:L-proline amide hydrolase
MRVQETTVSFELGGETASTWSRIAGELRPDDATAPAPLVVLHGGPGGTHNYLLSLCDLARDGRAVVHYDQLGNGRSTHFPERGADFWTVELFVRELLNLVESLGIRERHHVLGHSWGGCLAQEYALTQPAGLRSLVLADTSASWPDQVAELRRLRAELPPEVEATLRRHEGAGTTDDPEYVEAHQAFRQRHGCRLDPLPPEMVETFAWNERDPTVNHTMVGPPGRHEAGSIRDWQTKDRLSSIRVPTLLVSGRHDYATPALQEALLTGIRGAEWALFDDSSHSPHVEERERYMQVVGEWLASHD